MDGNGNRIAAIKYGAENVVVIVGKNKIVEDKSVAITRLKTIAAPKNVLRLNKNTPCAKTGICLDCNSPDRICSTYAFHGRQSNKDRITVIIVGEEYGF